MKSKFLKRATMACLAVVYMLLMCFAMSGCSISDKLFTTEDFEYRIYTKEYSDGTRHKYVSIIGLTEVGKTKEVLIFPREIRGIPVEGFYQLHVVGKWWSIKSKALKRAYLPGGEAGSDLFFGCPNLEKIICYEFMRPYSARAWEIPGNTKAKAYIKSTVYDKENYKDGLYCKNRGEGGSLTDIYFANVSYMYNYEGSQYGSYYFVDDYDYGSKIEYIPKDPTREGYTFGGWYKEEECVNAWNFDTDTLPEEKTEENEDGGTIVLYQETRLYAKWTKK